MKCPTNVTEGTLMKAFEEAVDDMVKEPIVACSVTAGVVEIRGQLHSVTVKVCEAGQPDLI